MTNINSVNNTNNTTNNNRSINNQGSTRDAIEASRQRIEQIRGNLYNNQTQSSSQQASPIANIENQAAAYQANAVADSPLKASQSSDGNIVSFVMADGVEVHFNKETKQVLVKDGDKQQTIWRDPKENGANVKTHDGIEIKDNIGIKLSNGANLVLHLDPTEDGGTEIGHITVNKDGKQGQAGKTIQGVTYGDAEFKPDQYLNDIDHDGVDWLNFTNGKFNKGDVRAGHSEDGVVTSFRMDGGVEVHYNKETNQILIKDGDKQQVLWNDPRDANRNVRAEDGSVEYDNDVTLTLSNGAKLAIHMDPAKDGGVAIGHIALAKDGQVYKAGKTIDGFTNFDKESLTKFNSEQNQKLNEKSKTVNDNFRSQFKETAKGEVNSHNEIVYSQFKQKYTQNELAGLQNLMDGWLTVNDKGIGSDSAKAQIAQLEVQIKMLHNQHTFYSQQERIWKKIDKNPSNNLNQQEKMKELGDLQTQVEKIFVFAPANSSTEQIAQLQSQIDALSKELT